MKIKSEDEYLHPPLSEDPSWLESYHFNGYDPANKLGITINRAIKSVLGYKLDTIALHSENPLFFYNYANIENEDSLNSGTLKMSPLHLLKTWKIQMKDLFHRTQRGIPLNDVEKVEFDLHFHASAPPFKFSTKRGDRYEQIGYLTGTINVRDECIHFNGKGIRDHSWEIRNFLEWEKWYWLLGCFKSGDAISFLHIDTSKHCLGHGWYKTDNKYYEIHTVEVESVFSQNILRECQIDIKTPNQRVKLDLEILSFISLSLESLFASNPTENQEKEEIIENLVQLNKEGHGIFWYKESSP